MIVIGAGKAEIGAELRGAPGTETTAPGTAAERAAESVAETATGKEKGGIAAASENTTAATSPITATTTPTAHAASGTSAANATNAAHVANARASTNMIVTAIAIARSASAVDTARPTRRGSYYRGQSARTTVLTTREIAARPNRDILDTMPPAHRRPIRAAAAARC